MERQIPAPSCCLSDRLTYIFISKHLEFKKRATRNGQHVFICRDRRGGYHPPLRLGVCGCGRMISAPTVLVWDCASFAIYVVNVFNNRTIFSIRFVGVDAHIDPFSSGRILSAPTVGVCGCGRMWASAPTVLVWDCASFAIYVVNVFNNRTIFSIRFVGVDAHIDPFSSGRIISAPTVLVWVCASFAIYVVNVFNDRAIFSIRFVGVDAHIDPFSSGRISSAPTVGCANAGG